MSKNSNLKKKIGEKAYNFLICNFNDDFLGEHLPSLFLLITDIREIKEEEFSKLKILLNQKLENKKEETKLNKTAKELLDEAGFILFDDIKEKKDYMKFKKYYKESELLCKFNSYDATKRYPRLFWIIKKDIAEIKRPNNPTRQDEYGTSCMSVGISQNKKNVIQICNRYNHTVNGCDNTYNCNLDNIVEGLTLAFNQDYNLNLLKNNSIEFDNFYSHNGKFIYYYKETNGKKYGNNTIDGEYFDPSQFLIFENYILDLKNKNLKTGDNSKDSFVDLFNEHLKNGFKIEIRKGEPKDEDEENKIVIYI